MKGPLRGGPLMDEMFFIGTEEIERDAIRFRRAGYGARIVPKAQVLHLVGETYRSKPELSFPAMDVSQAALFIRRAQRYSPLWARLDSAVAAIDHATLFLLLRLRLAKRRSAERERQAAIWGHLVGTDLRLLFGGAKRAAAYEGRMRKSATQSV